MKSTKYLVGAAALALALGAGALSVSAYQGDYSQAGPNYTAEKHAIMEVAFENNNYDAWLEQMAGRGRVTQVVTPENFAQFAKAHQLGQEGDAEGANAIRAELGLRSSNGERMGMEYKGANGERSGQGEGQKHGGRGMRGMNASNLNQ